MFKETDRSQIGYLIDDIEDSKLTKGYKNIQSEVAINLDNKQTWDHYQEKKNTLLKKPKCFHCESENRNTIKMGARVDGTEEWKCFDCEKRFLI